MNIVIALAFPFIGLFFLIYLLIRNNWVYKQRIWWNNKVYEYQIDLLNTKRTKEHDKYSYTILLNSIDSYNGMLFHYSWKLESFIRDKKLFDLVNNHKVG